MATMIFFMITCVIVVIITIGMLIIDKLEAIRMCIIDVESELEILNEGNKINEV